MLDKRIEWADRGPKPALHIIVLETSVKLEKIPVLQNMDRETLRSSRFCIIQTTFIIVKLKKDGRGIGHIYRIII